MLSRQMRAEFDKRGVVYLRGAFSEDAAAAMRRRVWARLARLGVLEHDQSTWAAAPVTGLNKAIKRDAVFTAVGSPPRGARSGRRPGAAQQYMPVAVAGSDYRHR